MATSNQIVEENQKPGVTLVVVTGSINVPEHSPRK
jgi:hypothetical protein